MELKYFHIIEKKKHQLFGPQSTTENDIKNSEQEYKHPT